MIKLYNLDVKEALKRIPDESIDLVVTSPPYWALRNYGNETDTIWGGVMDCEHEFLIEEKKKSMMASAPEPNLGPRTKEKGIDNEGRGEKSFSYRAGFCKKCGAWKGSLGLEPDFNLYIKHLCDIFDEIKRVLKNTGVCFVNLGDSYGGSGNSSGHTEKTKNLGYTTSQMGASKGNKDFTKGMEKSLCLIPERFIIEMQDRGWIVRNKIIWYKRNCMPSPVKDRFTVDFENVFFFTKKKKYFFERQKQLSQYKDSKGNISDKARKQRAKAGWHGTETKGIGRNEPKAIEKMGDRWCPPTRNVRCVWDITPKPFKEKHFAVFPPELVEIPIKAGCPQFVCSKCGKPKIPIYTPTEKYKKILEESGSWTEDTDKDNNLRNEIGFKAHTKKYAVTSDYKISFKETCSCNSHFIPGIVLDPFAGSGTTLEVARRLNRDSIGIEISEKYCKIIEKRLFNGNKPLLSEFEVIK